MFVLQRYSDVRLLKDLIFNRAYRELKKYKCNVYETFRSRKLSFLAAIDEVGNLILKRFCDKHCFLEYGEYSKKESISRFRR